MIPKSRIVSTDSNSNLLPINIFAKFPSNEYTEDDVNDTILNALQHKYNFTITNTVKNEAVWLVQPSDTNLLNKRETVDNTYLHYSAKKRHFFRGFTLKEIFSTFENGCAIENKKSTYFKIDPNTPFDITKKKYDLTLHSDITLLVPKLKKNYGLDLNKQQLPIEKLKLTFSQEMPLPKYNPKEKLTDLNRLFKKNYETDKMLGEWTSFRREKFNLKLFNDKKGKISGEMTVLGTEKVIKCEELIVTGNKISYSIDLSHLEGEISKFEFWFLDTKITKGHMDSQLFMELQKK